ncbi:MAG TPA: hypothetical protein VH723_07940 [Candidatus Limnocylindrales bacterium]|jgi:hypothetical protein
MTGLSLALSLIALDAATASRGRDARPTDDDPPPLDGSAWHRHAAAWRRWAADGGAVAASPDADYPIEVGAPATSGA